MITHATISVSDHACYTENVSVGVTLDTSKYDSSAKENVNAPFEIANALMHLIDGTGFSADSILEHMNEINKER